MKSWTTVKSSYCFIPIWIAVFCAFHLSAALPAEGSDLGKRLVEGQCSTCHKFAGKPESRFKLKAPDLMWGGSKFQREWLVSYLTGKEGVVYQKGYRWDKSRKPVKHLVVSKKKAQAIADYFRKKLIDRRVKKKCLGPFSLHGNGGYVRRKDFQGTLLYRLSSN